MATGTLDTIIRMFVDSTEGVAATERLNSAQKKLSTGGVQMLGAGFGSLTTQALAASGGLGVLGGQSAFVSRGLGLVGQTIGMVNPLLMVAAVGVGALAAAFVTKREKITLATEAIQVNSDALVTLISKNAEVAAIAERMRQSRIAELESEKSVLETKINNTDATRQLFDAEMQQAILRDQSFAPSERLIELQKFGNMTAKERVNRLAEVIAELAKLNSAEADAAKATAKLAEAQERLNAANEDALAGAIAEQLQAQADNAQKLLDIETQRAQLRARKEDAGLTEIIAASEAIIAAEQIAYETRLENANAFDGSRQVIEAQFTFFVEQEEARRLDAIEKFTASQIAAAKKTAEEEKKIRLTSAQVELRSMAGKAAQMLIIQKASLGEVVASIIAEQQARLAALAIVALIEGIYYSFTNPGTAASKFTAAAMAGAGAGALAAIGTAFTPQGAAGETEEQSALAGTAGTSRTGRTLVQQGPITLNYHAVLTVEGHVVDITGLHDLFSEWNEAQLRRANYDVTSRARGNG